MAGSAIERELPGNQAFAHARIIRNIVRIVFALTLPVTLIACSGGRHTPAIGSSIPAAKTGLVSAAATTKSQSDGAFARLGQAAGCPRLTRFTPTKPVSRGAFCTFSDGITLNLLMFTNTADRDAMLKFNYAKNHPSGYGDNWAVFGLYDDLRPTSQRNRTVSADVTEVTSNAGGTLLK